MIRPLFFWLAIALLTAAGIAINVISGEAIGRLRQRIIVIERQQARAQEILVFTNGFRTYQGAFITNDADMVLVIREKR